VARGTAVGTGGTGRGFRRIVVLLICLVIVPTAALLAVGILMLVFWQARLNVVFGILVVTLVGCLVTGTVLALVLLRREAKLSKLQLDFVSKVSHELRTPLTSIRMFAEMLKESDGRDPQETRTCLEVLERETARLSERIERLLDWGRMEAGRRTYDLQPQPIAALVDEAVQAFEAATVGRRHEVRVELQEGLPGVLADRGAMVDALVNLLSNAYKYTPDESVIVIGADADTRAVRLWVRDSGIGIAAKEHRRIFQKFYRVDERLARDVEGSGLGLAIVRHIAVGHGGRVEVASDLGRGSTFTIVLPRQPAPAAAAAPASQEASG
jgi:two-component system, OmpR family, phosphate regulon sensor histidine kinase PhoR